MTREVNLRIAAALGIDVHNVVGFHLRCWVGEVPRLRITKNVIDRTSITLQTDQFDITLRDDLPPGPLDLDQLCYHAIKRLRHAVDESWIKAQDELRRTFERRLEEIWR